MKKISLFSALVLALALVGCNGGDTSQDSISAEAAKLKKNAQGTPDAPPVPGLQQMSGGGGQAPSLGPKPGRK
jgi:hypothetical protein